MRFWIAVCCCVSVSVLGAGQAAASPAKGKAIEVIDGDTVRIKPDQGGEQVLCIRGADAPALDQPFGKEARDRLKELVEGKEVMWAGPVHFAEDRAGRSVLMWLPEGEKQLSKLMIADGLAWHVERHCEGREDLQGLAAVEREARDAKKGLWSAEKPVAPWDWRAGAKNAKPDQPAAPR